MNSEKKITVYARVTFLLIVHWIVSQFMLLGLILKFNLNGE